MVVTKSGRAYNALKQWWQETTIYPLEWLDAAINSLNAQGKLKCYMNRYGVAVIEVVEEPGVSARYGVEISGIPSKPFARSLREVRGEEISQLGFEKLIYEHMEKARKDPELQRKLKMRFEQICDKANWKRAIPTMKFTYYLDALDIAAAIAWYHGGVDYKVISPSEIQVWSKGYYYYTGGA